MLALPCVTCDIEGWNITMRDEDGLLKGIVWHDRDTDTFVATYETNETCKGFGSSSDATLWLYGKHLQHVACRLLV